MFKRFLMDNAHRESIKNLFRWWNGHVFSFKTVPGADGGEHDGFDSGMEEAEAALNSDQEFSDEGENFGDDADSRYQADQPALQMNTESRPDDLSTNFVQLTISEHSAAPPDPVAAPVDAIVVSRVRVHELTSVHSAGVAFNFLTTDSFRMYEYLTLLMIS